MNRNAPAPLVFVCSLLLIRPCQLADATSCRVRWSRHFKWFENWRKVQINSICRRIKALKYVCFSCKCICGNMWKVCDSLICRRKQITNTNSCTAHCCSLFQADWAEKAQQLANYSLRPLHRSWLIGYFCVQQLLNSTRPKQLKHSE